MDRVAQALIDALKDDLTGAGLALHAGIFDAAAGQWIAGDHPEEPTGFEPGLVLCGAVTRISPRDNLWLAAGHLPPGNTWHSLWKRADGGPDLAELVDQVQDWAIDELSHGWPELADDDGRFAALLHPGYDGDAVAWFARGEPVARVGQLRRLQIIDPSS